MQEKKGELDLFYFDESGFSLDSQVPYAYQPIGKTIEIPSSRSKRINVLGFLSTDNKFAPYCFECSVNTDVVVACFNDFAKTITKKTVLIIDNAPTHHSGQFVEKIPDWEEKGLFIKYLPPYSPELNLIEILWRFIKYRWLPFSAYLSYENLVCQLEKILQTVGTEYRINFA